MKTETQGVLEKPRWMVVDDNVGILQMLSTLLAAISGARICCFESGEQALAAYLADPESYQLVITDLEMPGMNGVELCDHLHVRAPHLKVVLATGNHAAVDSRTAQEFGFSGLLYKPFTFDGLEHLLEHIGVLETRHNELTA
ncbi:MAG TPA: response regulator [Verrucomicrobiae bacterium]